MIYLKEKTEQTILIPKNTDDVLKSITLISRINNTSYVFEVEDTSEFTDYYKVTVDTSGVPTGEYVAMFASATAQIGTDLFFIGDLENTATQYNNIEQYIEYEADKQ